jgi:hypothetical protein
MMLLEMYGMVCVVKQEGKVKRKAKVKGIVKN